MKEYKMQKSNRKLSILSLLALVAALPISTTANADHRTNAEHYDIIARGTSYPGYLTKTRCETDKKESCTILVNDCGDYNSDIFTTKRVNKLIIQNLNDGQTMPVHTLTSTGHWLKKSICTLNID